MIYRGFRFGMLLQLAIGPICTFIFQTAVSYGFYVAQSGVLGVALVDGLFILAAMFGLAPFLDKPKIKWHLKFFGAIILLLFGLSIILGQLDIYFLPSLKLPTMSYFNNIFVQSLLLTAANPLTILFWAGVFSSKVTEENLEKRSMFLFGFGAFTATLFFLTCIALLGSLLQSFLADSLTRFLNIVVGFLLIYFGLRNIVKTSTENKSIHK